MKHKGPLKIGFVALVLWGSKRSAAKDHGKKNTKWSSHLF